MILELPHKPIKWLIDNIGEKNIASQFDETTLQKIGSDVVEMYDYDKASRADWEAKIESGIKIAKQIIEEKTYPWPGAANSKDSLMAEAAAQFAARAGGEVVRGQDVVKVKVTGSDPNSLKEKRAKRVGTYMSWECTDGMDEWESENDQLLTSLSLIGMYYKKTFCDPLKGRTVSYARSPMHVVVHEDAKTLIGTRVTEEILLNANDVQERIRSGLWLDISKHLEDDEYGSDEMFLEQHRTLDLDGDGYQEPYVVTVHKETKAVCRIVPCYEEENIKKDGSTVIRITRYEYFTEFPFLLPPDGKFHKIGWAHLLGPNTEIVNAIVNQLLDAGHLANCPPIFAGKGAKLPAGGLRVQPGKIIPVETTGQDIRANLVVQQVVGPSDVLFKLLGMLIEKGQKLANLSDSMQGETGGANVPATTTLALLDQALKVYTSILKRLFRSYKQEFQKLYHLDRQYLTDADYLNVIDATLEDLAEIGIQPGSIQPDSTILVDKDFSEIDRDIQPVMDPTASSEAIRLARLNAMAQAAGLPPAVGRIYLQGIGVAQKDIDAIFPQEQGPNPAMIEMQAKILDLQHKNAQKDQEISLRHMEVEQKEALNFAQIENIDTDTMLKKAQAIKLLSDADASQVQAHVGAWKAEMDDLRRETDQEIARIAAQVKGEQDGESGSATDDSGGTGAVEKPAIDAEGAGVPGSEAAGGGGGLDASQLPPELVAGSGGMDDAANGAPIGLQPSASPGELPPPGPMQ